MLGLVGKRWLSTMHVTFGSGLLGATAASEVILLANGAPASGEELRSVHLILRQVNDFLIIPAAMGILLTSLALSACTKWGFFRFRWVAAKWALTLDTAVLGAVALGPWKGQLLAMASADGLIVLSDPTYACCRQMLLILGGLQVMLLVLLLVLGQAKPWGTIRPRAVDPGPVLA